MDVDNPHVEELEETNSNESYSMSKYLIMNSNQKTNNIKEVTKVVEVFVNSEGNVFAHCSICLYKAEIQNIKFLLDHFLQNHLKINTNSGFYSLMKKPFDSSKIYNPADLKQFESNKSKFLDVNENKIQFTEESHFNPCKAVYGKNNKTLENQKKTSKLNFEATTEVEKDFVELSAINRSAIDEFENNVSYDPSDSEYSNSAEIESIDPFFEETKSSFDEESTLDSFQGKNADSNVENNDNLDSKEIEKTFYNHLTRLDSDQSLCQICQTKFRHLARHYKNQHPEIILCEIGRCYQTFNTLPELKTHQKIFHYDPDNAFSCSFCKYKSNNIHYFRFHYQRIHLNIKDFECDICEMKFFAIYEKIKHMRIHTGLKPYNCIKCDAKYPTKQKLNLHIQKYHSEPQFECSLCNIKFYRKQTLKEHQLTKHNSDEKKITCEICGEKFFLKKNLRDHYNNNHKPDRKRWTCNECGKSFSRNSNLRDHKKIHIKK